MECKNTTPYKYLIENFKLKLFYVSPCHKFPTSEYGDDDSKYVINLDDIYKWLGYYTKQKLKDLLIKNFTLNRDYINKIPEEILLTQSGKLKSELLIFP